MKNACLNPSYEMHSAGILNYTLSCKISSNR